MSANTPAEARTGTSDRVAAALNELAALRAKLHPASAISTDLAHVVQLLRARGGPVPTRVWMHRCGVVLINDMQPPPCHVCVSTPQIPFVQLYTLGEVR